MGRRGERRARFRAVALTVLVACAVSGAAIFWLWRGYTFERRLRDRLMVVEGDMALELLETGFRFHCRMAPSEETLARMLEEYAMAPRVRGLCILTLEGEVVATGGEMPEGMHPPPASQRRAGELQQLPVAGGVVFARIGRLDTPRHGPSSASEATPVMRDPRLGEPLWLSVFLDASEVWRLARSSYWRFVLSVSITVLAVLLGVAIVMLALRQNRLGAELGLRNERLERLEERALVGAGLAHETKNPLSLIRGLAQSLLDSGDDAGRGSRCAGEVIDTVDRVVGRINSFLEYARAASPTPEPVRIDEVVGATVKYFTDEARSKGIGLQVDVEAVRGFADSQMLRQVVVNLVANALAACSEGESVRVRVGMRGRREWGLEVSDTGRGIEAADLDRVTQPYFSRREGGTGLGLAIVYEIVRGHGWTFGIDSHVGHGTTVRILGAGERLPSGGEERT